MANDDINKIMSGAALGQAEALAQSPEAKDLAAFTEAVGHSFTPQGIQKNVANQDAQMAEMQKALKAGDWKAASKPAVDMSMALAMGTIGPAAVEKTAAADIAKALTENEKKLAQSANKIKAGKPSELFGEGEEIVLDAQGEPIGKLVNGDLVKMADGGIAASVQNQSASLKEYYPTNKKRKKMADGGISDLPTAEDINTNFEQLKASPSPFIRNQEQTLPQIAKPQASTVNLRNPQGQIVSVSSDQYQDALAEGYQPVSRDELLAQLEQEKFTTTGQKVLAGVEGLAEGLLGPIATGAEEALSQAGVPGLSAPERLKREEFNPYTRGAAEAAGFIGPAIATLGGSAALKGAAKLTQAGLIGTAEKMAAKGLGLEAKSGFINQVGNEAVKGAFGAALFQGGQEITDAFNNKPGQTAETAISNLGMAAVLGGLFGGAFGAAAQALNKPALKEVEGTFVSELDRPALEAGNFEAIVRNSNAISQKEKEGILASLSKEKKNAPEIRAAAEENGWPILEGMVADSHWIQKAEDSLINGATTFSGIKRKELYDNAYNLAVSDVDRFLGEGSRLTKAELGNALKEKLTARLRVQSSPIEEMYKTIKNDFDVISLDKGAIQGIKSELSAMKELTLSPKSVESQAIKRVLDELDNLKTVDDIKQYKSLLRGSVAPTASSSEKRIIGIISDKLRIAEEESIVNTAKALGVTDATKAAQVADLVNQRKVANALYKDFITDVKTLSERLGKGRVHGLEDALHFINERLTPEEVATKIFAKKDSEFLNFFAKKFPEEMALVRDYQKQALREASTLNGVLNPKKLFNNINKLEPEIQGHIFDQAELNKLKKAEIYLDSFPKRFNPSGTSEMMAFRQAFESPKMSVIANVRDAGIEKFIKLAHLSPEISSAVKLGEATVKGFKTIKAASRSVFDLSKEALPATVISMSQHRDKLKKLVDTYSTQPAKFMDMNDNNPVPEYASVFAMAGLRAVQYLDSIKPKEQRLGIMDKPLPISEEQKQGYDRQVALVQQPLMVFGHIKQGTLIPEDLQTIQAVYPELYTKMVDQLTEEMVTATTKGHIVPLHVRQTLSLFVGVPLDSDLTPQGVLATQQPKAQDQGPNAGALKTNKGSLSKMPQNYQTGLQSREAHKMQK